MTTAPQTPAQAGRLQVDVHLVDLEILKAILDAFLGELEEPAEGPAHTDCCSPEEQSSCCDAEDKAVCCGAATGGSCGCR
jgi:hypothetical protein